MKVICINGMPCSGKDTFVQYCQEIYGHALCKNISTVDFVKEIAANCGWDGTKTPKNRKFLSDLKDLLTQWNDVPYQKIAKQVKDFEDDWKEYQISDRGIVFIHVREPKEIKKFADRLNAITVLVRREAVETSDQSNHADQEVFNFLYDYEIINNGTLQDLKKSANTFINEIFKDKRAK